MLLIVGITVGIILVIIIVILAWLLLSNRMCPDCPRPTICPKPVVCPVCKACPLSEGCPKPTICPLCPDYPETVCPVCRTCSACQTNLTPATSSENIKPRPSFIQDCGYGTKTRGWYDFSNQGVKNDFCRWVGDEPDWWFSCQKAGSDILKTPSSEIYDENASHEPLLPGTYGCFP